jgi:hypothetical protein
MVNYLGDPVNVGDLGSAYSQIQAICNAMQPLMEKDVTLPSFEIEEPQSLGSDIRKKRPDPQPFGVSPRGAEYYCAQWMDFLGFDDVLVTERTRDGGYDIGAKGFVAQVKNFTLGKVSVVEVRQIYGVAQNLKVSAIVFSATGATTDAQTFCNEAGIGLFQFDSEAGSLWPVNETAAGFIQLIRREVECKRGLLTLIEQIQPYYLEALGDFREIVRAQGELFNLHARLPARIASRVSDLATLVRVFTNEVNVELMTDSSELAGPRLKAMASFASKYPPFQAEVQDLLSEVADLATIHRDSEELPE